MRWMLSGHCHREAAGEGDDPQALHDQCHYVYPRPTGGTYMCPCPKHQGENRCRVCRHDHQGNIAGYDVATNRCVDNDACTRRLHPASVAIREEITAVRTTARRDRGKPGRECECNCGGTTKGGRFIPGHDMKLKSALRRAAGEGDAAAQIELEKRNWL